MLYSKTSIAGYPIQNTTLGTPVQNKYPRHIQRYTYFQHVWSMSEI